MTFPPLDSDHVVVSFSIDFKLQKGAPFHYTAFDYSGTDLYGSCDYLRNVPGEDISKLGASAAATEFCEWVLVVVAVYIPFHKYHAKPYSSPWFSAALAAVIAHRNHFFHLYQQSSVFTVFYI